MFDYFNYFVSKGNHPLPKDILNLESTLTFDSLKQINVDKMIEHALIITKEKYNRPIGIRIHIQNTPIHEYLMESITNEWLLRKEKVVFQTKHSSYYIFLDNIESHQYDDLVNDESYGVCAGSFPLIVGNEFVGSVTCTGLRPHEDHDVVVEVLKAIKGGK